MFVGVGALGHACSGRPASRLPPFPKTGIRDRMWTKDIAAQWPGSHFLILYPDPVPAGLKTALIVQIIKETKLKKREKDNEIDMTHPRHNRRDKRLIAQSDAEFRALKTENFRLRNALLAPRAADGRLEEARKDALAVHIDMETLERIEQRLERLRRDTISRRIRDRVMKLDGEKS